MNVHNWIVRNFKLTIRDDVSLISGRMLIHRKTIVSDICHQFIFSQTVRIQLPCWSWAAHPHNVGDDLLVVGDRVFDWEIEPTVYQRKYWEYWDPKAMLLPGILERILRTGHDYNKNFLIIFTFFFPGFSLEFSCFLLSGKKMRIRILLILYLYPL